MPLFNPPKELNGFPLSERSRWLMYAPICLLIDPRGAMQREQLSYLKPWRVLYDEDTGSLANVPGPQLYTYLARANAAQ